MAVLWAKQLPGADHDQPFPGTRTLRVPWQVRVDSLYTSNLEVQLSPKVPQVGHPLFAYEPDPADPVYGTYRVVPDGLGGFVVKDNQIAVVLVEVRQSPDPYYFDLVVHYDGVDDPTAQPPEAASETVEYQEYLAQDVNGRPVMNSAFDPIDGGMPRTGFFKRITITRNLPAAAWSMQHADNYVKTLNAETFFLPGQQRADGTPARYEAGYVLLNSVSEQRVLRRKGETTELNSYYWRVTVELYIDLEVVRQPEGDFRPRLHRWVVPDAGFNALQPKVTPIPPGVEPDTVEHVIKPIQKGFHTSSQPCLLDGRGRPLVKNAQTYLPKFVPLTRSHRVGNGLSVDFYATPMNKTEAEVKLAVPESEGLKQNDGPTVGSVEKVPGAN